MKRDLVIWMSLVFFVAVSGCARKSSFSATPQGMSPQEEAQIQEADLHSVQFEDSNLTVARANMDGAAYDYISGQLLVRTDKITNPTSGAVRVWLRPQFNGITSGGLCIQDRAQYTSNGRFAGFQLAGGTLISKNLVQGDWSEIEIEAHQSASIQWFAEGSFVWTQGPRTAPSESCNQTSSPRGWAGIYFEGSGYDEVRVSAPNVAEAEATGASNFLDSTRVLVLFEGSFPISAHP